MTDKQLSATLIFLGENRQAVVSWMKAQLPTASTSKSFLMMDSTHIYTVSEQLGINARGYNPNHDFDKQVRLMYLFAAELNQPVYYWLINGNITYIKSMSLCVKEMNVKNVVFIADKGFYSLTNRTQLKDGELHYIIPMQKDQFTD